MDNKYNRINYTNSYFRKNLKYLLDKGQITKTELEKGLDIGDGSLSRYCRIDGAPEPKVGMLNSIANVFGVTIDELINIDLEKKEVDIKESNERKEVLFCKKLIKETGENLCDWEVLNFYNHWFIEMVGYEDCMRSLNWLEPDNKFKSRFTYSLYEPEELSAFTVIINGNVQVVIMKFIDNVEHDYNTRYELYLIKDDGKVIPSCASHKFDKDDFLSEALKYDEVLVDILTELYNVARDYCYYGKDNREKEMIYDEYLVEIPF